MNFGEKLKLYRDERNLSQEELAKKLNTSKQVISRYETNKRIPKITIADEYSKILELPLQYLLDNNINNIDELKNFIPEQSEINTEKVVTDEQLKLALFGDINLNDELLQDVKDYIEFIKEKKLNKS